MKNEKIFSYIPDNKSMNKKKKLCCAGIESS